jgi:integrase
MEVERFGAYLKERHAQGVLPRPFHLQIDTPRVYRGERLPRAFPWARIQALIQSIDRSEPMGRRDFILLYLAAASGLRSGERVRLTFESIAWCNRALHVRQAKTRQMLQLPLTDETANAPIEYATIFAAALDLDRKQDPRKIQAYLPTPQTHSKAFMKRVSIPIIAAKMHQEKVQRQRFASH